MKRELSYAIIALAAVTAFARIPFADKAPAARFEKAVLTKVSPQNQCISINEPRLSIGAPALYSSDREGNLTVTTNQYGIITDVTGAEEKHYARSSAGTAYFIIGSTFTYEPQSGYATIIEDGNNVYIKNPVNRYVKDTWIKGTKDGNTLTIASNQYLGYNGFDMEGVILSWGRVNADGSIEMAQGYSDKITFTIDGDKYILNDSKAFDGSSEAYFIGCFYDSDGYYTGYGDAETVLTYDPDYKAPSTEPVTLPQGATTETWILNGKSVFNDYITPVSNQNVQVAFVGNEVYVQGISSEFANAWAKGTLDGNTVTFAKLQYVDEYYGYNVWIIGYDDATGEIIDVTAKYDPEKKSITFDNDIIYNVDPYRLSYTKRYADVVIKDEQQSDDDPIITDLTAEVPYNNTFESKPEQEQAVIYDANKDARTFEFTDIGGNIAARAIYSQLTAMDDYIVFPGLDLKAGKTYKVSVDARSHSQYYSERFEIIAGKEAKVSQLNIPVIAPTDITTEQFTTISNPNFTVAEDGRYYLALHGISDIYKYYLYIDNFSVVESDPNSLSTISGLSLTADETGRNVATLSFTMPSTTVAGATIADAKIKAVVKRNDEPLALDGDGFYAPGQKIVITDNVPSPGNYTYIITATNSDGLNASDPVKCSAYIGEDVPVQIGNLTAADKNSKVRFAWEAPTAGINKGVVVTENLTYNIYPVKLVEFMGNFFPQVVFDSPYATGVKGTEAEIDYDTNEGEHTFTYFAVSAISAGGESDIAFTNIITGQPYPLPIRESAVGNQLNNWWATYNDPVTDYYDDAGFSYGTYASDNDNASFGMVMVAPGWMTFESGKIDLAGAAHPIVSVDYASIVGATLKIIAVTPDGETELKSVATGPDYANLTVPLTDFVGQPWIRVIFRGEFATYDDNTLYLDNIKIHNQLSRNLTLTALSVPQDIHPGEEFNVVATIENSGVEAVDGYTTELYLNGSVIKTAEGTALAPGTAIAVEFPLSVNIMSPTELAYRAVVNYADDEDASDNASETMTAKISVPAYPTVTDLSAAAIEGGVKLWWSAPETENMHAAPITDSFEQYESFALNKAGDWTFVDVDGDLGTYTIDGGPNFPNSGEAMAFIVFDASFDGLNETFGAHTGKQYMAAFSDVDGNNDDWMISPELSGDAQTVTFFARSYFDTYGLESFDFLCSSTDKDIESFTRIGGDDAVPSSHNGTQPIWEKYSFDLPAGTKYFAIRCTSADQFIFEVDDVTFIPANGAAIELSILGYNVYRDCQLITDTPVAAPGFEDLAPADGTHTYVVTTVYDKGESNISNEAVITTSGIETIEAGTMKIAGDIYSVDGRLVRKNASGTAGLAPGVYLVDGHKIFVK